MGVCPGGKAHYFPSEIVNSFFVFFFKLKGVSMFESSKLKK